VVMVLGAALAEDAGDKLGLLGVERHASPWEARTVVLTGRTALTRSTWN
jgi:hypothetical protein